MKFISVSLIIFAISGFTIEFMEEPYPNIYEQIDLDVIFDNERLFNQYVKCFLDEGSCTMDGHNFKQILPEIVVTQCARCNEFHKKLARKIFWLKECKPDLWTKFQNKYDPDNIYLPKLEEFIKEH